MTTKDEDLAKEAKLAAEKWMSYFKVNIDQYHRMHSFVLGKQWENDEEDMLTSFNKIPLQFNKLSTLINTLLGEQQQNTPQLEVVPMSGCNEETAKIRQILTKDIMLSSDAKTVYQVAASQAFIGGFGAYYLSTDYCHPKSFDLDIKYCNFKDSTRAFWDISAEDINKTDGMYAGYIYRMSRKKFRELYGKEVEESILKDGQPLSKSEVAQAVDTRANEPSFNWADEDAICILNYFKRKYKKETLYKLSNGKVLDKTEMDELTEKSREFREQLKQQEMMLDMQMMQSGEMPPEMQQGQQLEEELLDDDFMTLYDDGQPVRIEGEKESKVSRIMHYQIAGDYKLDEEEFPSEDLPVVFMDQHSYYDKNGKQHCRPFIIDAVDAQRYLNYLGTQSAYILKISRYDQFIGSKKNVQSTDTQKAWTDPTNVRGLLTYDETPSGAKPEQVRPPELSASLSLQYQRAIEDMYTSTGLYPSRLGQEGNEVSGVAIDARTKQGNYATYVAFNSINRAITAGGRILNQMIPKVYDTQRVMMLMTPDKGRQSITINEQSDEYGTIKNDLTKGTYEVRLQAGPSYEGQKALALESLTAVLNANPDAFNLIADLYCENLPLLNTLEITNRLKTLVPPEIIDAGKSGEMPQEQKADPEAMAMQADIQMKQEQLALKKQELEMRMQESQAKAEMEHLNLEMKKIQLLSDIEVQRLRYLAETDRTKSDSAISHADNLTRIITAKMGHDNDRHNNRNKQAK